MRAIEKKLQGIYERAEAEIQKLADEYRIEVLIPVCKRAKMTYLAGNGMFWFSPIEMNYDTAYNKVISTVDDAKRNKKRYLIQVLEDLNSSALESNVQCFGFYIADVTEKDLIDNG